MLARAQEIDKNVSQWIVAVKRVNPEPDISSHFPNARTNPKEFKDIYSLGFVSVPFIINHMEDKDTDKTTQAFLIAAVTNNLQLPYMIGSLTDENQEVSKDEDAYTPQWYTKKLKEYAKSVPGAVDKICDGDGTIEDKCEELDQLGMLAIPFLVDRIEKGEREWEACIQSQTLGMNAEERFQHLFADTDHALDYATKRSLVRSDFSVADWIKANQDDLNILKLFCA